MATLIDRHGAAVDDVWQYPGDTPAYCSPQAVVRPLQWDDYIARCGQAAAGLWIDVAQDPVALGPLLDQLRLIVVEFPKSRDGRGYTLARRLRERDRYQGDIRAAGPLLPDQFSELLQCGYTSLLAPPSVPPQRWREAARSLAQAQPRTLLERLSRQRQA
jgi:uncharacterized protein (DUF934 family)